MTREGYIELFDLRCRGALAASFIHANLAPTDEQWDMLRGEKEITLRDIGSIGFATVFDFSLSFGEGKRFQDFTINVETAE